MNINTINTIEYNLNATVNHFNYFLTNTASEIDKTIGPNNQAQYVYLCNPNENSFSLSPTWHWRHCRRWRYD